MHKHKYQQFLRLTLFSICVAFLKGIWHAFACSYYETCIILPIIGKFMNTIILNNFIKLRKCKALLSLFCSTYVSVLQKNQNLLIFKIKNYKH